jgi:hypothetical protein
VPKPTPKAKTAPVRKPGDAETRPRPKPMPTRKITPDAPGPLPVRAGEAPDPPEEVSDIDVMPAAPAPDMGRADEPGSGVRARRKSGPTRIEPKPDPEPAPADEPDSEAPPSDIDTPSSDDQFTAVDFNALLAAADQGRVAMGRNGKHTPIDMDELPGETLQTFIEEEEEKASKSGVRRKPASSARLTAAAEKIPGAMARVRRPHAVLVTALILAIGATVAGAIYVTSIADDRLGAVRTVQFRMPTGEPKGDLKYDAPHTVLGATDARIREIAEHLERFGTTPGAGSRPPASKAWEAARADANGVIVVTLTLTIETAHPLQEPLYRFVTLVDRMQVVTAQWAVTGNGAQPLNAAAEWIEGATRGER